VRRRLLGGLALLVVLGGAAYGVHAWRYAAAHVWTDDAQVEVTVSPVSARVAGHVVELLVGDNQPVRRGDLVLRVDPRDYQARLEQAQAAVATAEATLRGIRAELPLTREVTAAQADEARAAVSAAEVAVRAAESAVEEARARLEARRAGRAALGAEMTAARTAQRHAELELARVRQLLAGEYVARREFDQAEAVAETATARVEAAERRLVQADKEMQEAEAEVAARRLGIDQARQRVLEARAAQARAEGQRHQVPMKDAELRRAEARVRETQADLAMAELMLSYTEVRAPVDGIVSRRGVEVGQVVQAGQPLLAIVPLHAVWVVANFKETQLARVRQGQPATITVDGLPGRTFRGVVDSISAGTGSRFSLLPPENASGNWVKIVQRVPVKIVLDAVDGGNPQPLRAGMSAHVTVLVTSEGA
jgi:membrane fusion protein (multidrug efflux system)